MKNFFVSMQYKNADFIIKSAKVNRKNETY